MAAEFAIAVGTGIAAIGAATYAYVRSQRTDSAAGTTPTAAEAEAFVYGEDETVDECDEEEVTTENPLPEPVQEKEGLTDIKGLGPTRAEDLRNEGIDTPTDVYFAADSTLTDISGIGPTTVEQIRSDIGGIDYRDE